MQMTFFCARCKCYLCVSAVDYMAVVSVSVRWRGSLMASQCDGDSVTAAPPLMASVVLFVFRQQTAHFVSGIVFFFSSPFLCSREFLLLPQL